MNYEVDWINASYADKKKIEYKFPCLTTDPQPQEKRSENLLGKRRSRNY